MKKFYLCSLLGLSLLFGTGCTKNITPANPTSKNYHQLDQVSPEQLWTEYLALKGSLSPSPPEKAVDKLYEMVRIAEKLDKFSTKRQKTCEQRQDIFHYVNSKSREILGRCKSSLGDDELYLLAVCLGETNLGLGCGDKSAYPKKEVLEAKKRTTTDFNSEKNDQLWDEYQTILNNLFDEKKSQTEAVTEPTVIPHLERMVAIMYDPALSCQRAEEVRARANFVARNILYRYTTRGSVRLQLTEKEIRQNISQLGLVVANTSTPYSCN